MVEHYYNKYVTHKAAEAARAAFRKLEEVEFLFMVGEATEEDLVYAENAYKTAADLRREVARIEGVCT